MAKYTVQYEVVGFVDVEVEADSVNDAVKTPMYTILTGTQDVRVEDALEKIYKHNISPGDDWDWTPRIAYTEEGERVYG